jgi:hypothetical protein
VSEFDFLDRMFRRLNEMRSFQARAERGTPEWHAWESAVLAVKGSIQDFIEHRKAVAPAP